MKRIQKIPLALSVIIFVLSACLDSKNNAPSPATNAETTGNTTSTTQTQSGGTTPTTTGTTTGGVTTITVDCPTGSARMLANARTNDGPESENKTTGNTGTTTTSAATVCFDKEVLPFFQSSCAFSGCHNSQSKKDGYDLSTYSSIISKGIKAGSPNSSGIYAAMTKTGSERMPPAPYPAINKDKLDMISKWIQEGAQNKICGTSGGTTTTGGITTVVVNFATVNSIIQANCVSCHQTGFASAGVNLDSYSNIKNYGTNGRLYGSISGAAGYKKMPPSGQLTTCDIAIVKKWIDIGMPNN